MFITQTILNIKGVAREFYSFYYFEEFICTLGRISGNDD